MQAERHGANILISVCIVVAALFASGCTETAAEAQTEATPTPQPEVISMEVVDLNGLNYDDMPSPTPTPEPTPTPVPFSVYAPTINMTYEELVGSLDDMNVKARELLKDGFPDPTTYYIIVDLQWQVTMVFKRIDDGTKFGKPNYDEPVRYMLCSTGNPNSEHGHETTKGIFQIEVPKERFYQFVNLEAAQYLTLIRSRTYFHSVLYDKAKDLSTLIQESYDDLGTKASHACIRLTVPDARWIWYNIGYGTTCEVREGDPLDSFTSAVRSQLILPESISNIRLKAGTAPWTDNWTIEDVEHVLDYKYEPAPLPDLGDGDEEEVTPTPFTGETTPTPTTSDAGTGGDTGDTGDTGGTDGGSTEPVADPTNTPWVFP
jgi:hypothetical protein